MKKTLSIILGPVIKALNANSILQQTHRPLFLPQQLLRMCERICYYRLTANLTIRSTEHDNPSRGQGSSG
jgi:hypothetical protein